MACGYKAHEGVQICPAVHLAVAVGRGKSSVQALKWALEMQTETENGTLYLLHIQHPLRMIETPLGYLPFDQANEECQRHAKQQQISATNKILQRYLRMCGEKKVNPEVHCVESSSIPEAIVEQIAKLGILKLVIGSSSKFNLIKLFKESKIAFVAQHAPDFCAVMVIHNGKLSTVKNATVSKNVSLITSSKKESVNLISSPRTSCSLPYSSPSTKTCLNFNTGHQEIFPEDNESCVERNKETKKNSLQSLMKEKKKIKNLGMALSVAKADAKSLRKELDITKHQAEIDKRSCLEALTMVETLERNLVREVELRKLAEKRFRKEKKTQSGFVEYSFEELKSATNNFSDNAKLGGGGYGGVYRGILNDVMVAVKVLQKEEKDGEQQFQHEVEVLSSIWHPHIVDLIGVCKEKLCIVYEYMENGSLEDCLSCKMAQLLLLGVSVLRSATRLPLL